MSPSLRPRQLAARLSLAAALTGALAPSWALSPSSFYNASASSGIAIGAELVDPLLGPTTLYKSYAGANPSPGSSPTPWNYDMAASLQLPAGAGGAGSLVEQLVTGNGQYGLSATALTQARGTRTGAQVSTAALDAQGQATDSASPWVQAYGSSVWSDKFYIAPSDAHPAGSFGAILVGLTLTGDFGATQGSTANAADALLSLTSQPNGAYASFTSRLDLKADTQGSWLAGATRYQKLLFQYGTEFSVSMSLMVKSTNNAQASFEGGISLLQLPMGAVLESGALLRGVGTADQLYGRVFNASSLNDPNTQWDFSAANGGAFTVPVPEPETWALMLFGLAAVGLAGQRRRR